jgi:signal transduction histidine kinase
LLSNAVRSSPLGSAVKISAQVRILDDGEHDMGVPVLSLSVRDAGGGLSVTEPLAVFDRFARSDRPTIRGLGERGPGLAVAKSLVEAHGGRIWFDIEAGQGTTFTFNLPLSAESLTAEPGIAGGTNQIL